MKWKSNSTICIWINSIATHVVTRLQTNITTSGNWDSLDWLLTILKRRKITFASLSVELRARNKHTLNFFINEWVSTKSTTIFNVFKRFRPDEAFALSDFKSSFMVLFIIKVRNKQLAIPKKMQQKASI